MRPRADRHSIRLFSGALIGALLIAGAAPGQAQKSRDLKRIEGDLATDRKRQRTLEQRSKIIASEMEGLREQMIAAARAVQEQEAHMTRLEDKLNELNEEADRRRAKLRQRHKQMQGTLAAMERLARNPPEALLLAPGHPIQVVRSATLLRAAVPQIQSRAQSLQEEIAALGRVQADILAQFEQLKAATDALEEERRKMRALVTRKASLRRLTDVEKQRIAKRVAQLTARARSLRELFGSLRGKNPAPRRPGAKAPPRAHKGPVAIRSFPRRGGVTLPARGRVVKAYGQSTGYGNTAKGITIAARAGAQVVAPFDGKVVFAGPFRGYGQILIIEHRGGYHTLLAGLGRLDSSVGQWLLAGEPIGAMAGNSGKKPQLYLELRRQGQPINPLPWVAYKTGRRRG